MIFQLLNIVGGAIVASEKIAEIVGRERVAVIKEKIVPFESGLGIILLLIGLFGFLERLGLFPIGLGLGASFPQALPLIAVGLVMIAPILERNPSLKGTIATLLPYASWVGLVAIACGLGSLVFGCIYPICYPLPF